MNHEPETMPSTATMRPTADAATTVAPDVIASCVAPCGLEAPLPLSEYIIPEEGYCVAVRALEEKTCYNQVEDHEGRFQTIKQGDIIVTALGERQALKGYSGHVPRHVRGGDTLHLLNLGGIVGRCTAALPDLGAALPVEVLGAVMREREGELVHARIQNQAIPPATTLADGAPLIVVSGTAMDTGKTEAACQIIQKLTKQGLRVGAAKLTGAALLRDVRRMREHGAAACTTFADAGIVSSVHKRMPPIAKGLLRHLNAEPLDAIVVEMGDGFIGPYGVDELLADQELQQLTCAHVVTATDLAGVWAADQQFRDRYRTTITAVTGPITDNAVGRRYVRQQLGLDAYNALQQSESLAQCVAATVPALD